MLRRAIELAERDHVADDLDGVSEQALVEAADELGVDVGAVRRAAAEERLGVLDHEHRFVDRLAGPATVSATRFVDGAADHVMALVDAWLRRSGGLKRRRLGADGVSADYVRRSDAVAGVQRTLRSVTGREDLGRVRRVRVVVQPVDATCCVVALVADLEVERTVALVGGSSVAGVGSAVSVVQAVTTWPLWWAGVPASVAAGVGLLRLRVRTVPDTEVSLQGVLDRVSVAEEPVGVLGDVRERLLGRSRSAG